MSVLLRNGPTCSVVGRGGPSTTEIARSNPSGVMGKSCKLIALQRLKIAQLANRLRVCFVDPDRTLPSAQDHNRCDSGDLHHFATHNSVLLYGTF